MSGQDQRSNAECHMVEQNLIWISRNIELLQKYYPKMSHLRLKEALDKNGRDFMRTYQYLKCQKS